MEKEKDFLNWQNISLELTGKRANLSKHRIPEKHKEKINALLNRVHEWLKEIS